MSKQDAEQKAQAIRKEWDNLLQTLTAANETFLPSDSIFGNEFYLSNGNIIHISKKNHDVVCPFFYVKNLLRIDGKLYMVCRAKDRTFNISSEETIQAIGKILNVQLHCFLHKQALNLVDVYLSQNLQAHITTVVGMGNVGWREGTHYTPASHPEIIFGNELDSNYQCRGSIDEQKQLLRTLLHTSAGTTILTALAAPLLTPLGLDNFTLFIGGESGVGKSTAAGFIASVFGNPKKLKRTGNMTASFIEVLFHQHQDVPVWLDELETLAGGDPTKFINLVYSHSSSEGKGRNGVNGLNRSTVTYKNVLMVTGEKDLDNIESFIKNTRSTTAGSRRRVVEVVAEMGYIPTATLSFKDIITTYSNNFGHLGVEYTKYIENLTNLGELYNYNYKMNDMDKMSSTFAAIMTVVDILKGMGIVDAAHATKLQTHVLKMSSRHKDNFKSAVDDETKIIGAVIEWATINGSRIEGWTAGFTNTSYSKERVDFLGGLLPEGTLAILPSEFTKICLQNGVTKSHVISKLKKSGILDFESGKNTKKVSIGVRQHCIVLKNIIEPITQEDINIQRVRAGGYAV